MNVSEALMCWNIITADVSAARVLLFAIRTASCHLSSNVKTHSSAAVCALSGGGAAHIEHNGILEQSHIIIKCKLHPHKLLITISHTYVPFLCSYAGLEHKLYFAAANHQVSC